VIVVDDEDAASRRDRPFGVVRRRLSVRTLFILGQRKPHHELAAALQSFAVRLDRSAVHGDQRSREAEPDPRGPRANAAGNYSIDA
jgi:hypothetical protein